jgi:regulator of sigma E protease
MTARSFWGLVSGKLSRKHVGGPIQMFQEASRSAKRGGGSLLGFMIFINVTLAVLNLLPIPILDGGHLLIFTYEAIKGSAISVIAYQRMTSVGGVLLLSLMVLALTNDIGRVLGFH